MHLSLWAVRYYGLKTEYVLYSAVATPTFGMGSAYFFHIAGMATVAGDRDDAIFLFESVVRGHHIYKQVCVEKIHVRLLKCG